MLLVVLGIFDRADDHRLVVRCLAMQITTLIIRGGADPLQAHALSCPRLDSSGRSYRAGSA